MDVKIEIMGLPEYMRVFNIKDIEHKYIEDILHYLEIEYSDFLTQHREDQLEVLYVDGTKEIIQENVTIDHYYKDGCKLLFSKKEKPKIRINARTEEKINYLEEEFPDEFLLRPSYKNSEASNAINEKLLIKTHAVHKLLTVIEWGQLTENNSVEQAGLLIGNRYKDGSGNIWGGVVDIIPLKYTTANRRAIKMTSESFYIASVQNFPLLQSENPDLEIIGWYHTHTYSDQPVFSGTDYQTQSTTFASFKSWFALVLNAQQRTFSAYYNSQAVLIKCFFEGVDLENSKFNFEIDENYFESEKKAKIKKGVYAEEQQKNELKKMKKELEKREKELNNQFAKLRIQEQKVIREYENLENKVMAFYSEKEKVDNDKKKIESIRAEADKKIKYISILEKMLEKVFPLAYVKKNKLTAFISHESIRPRMPDPSHNCIILKDGAFDLFYDATWSNSGDDFRSDMVIYGKILNLMRNVIEYSMEYVINYCIVMQCDSSNKCLIRSFIPINEIRPGMDGDAILFAMDIPNQTTLDIVKKRKASINRIIQLYVYIEETQAIYKMS